MDMSKIEKGVIVENFRGDLLKVETKKSNFIELYFLKSVFTNPFPFYRVSSETGCYLIFTNSYDVKKIFDFENYPELYL